MFSNNNSKAVTLSTTKTTGVTLLAVVLSMFAIAILPAAPAAQVTFPTIPTSTSVLSNNRLKNCTVSQAFQIINGRFVRGDRVTSPGTCGVSHPNKMADAVVTTRHIVNGSISTEKYGRNSISSLALRDNAVGKSQISTRAVQGSHINYDTITYAHIAAGAIRTAEIEDGAVKAADLDSAIVYKIDQIDYAQQDLAGATETINGWRTASKIANSAGATMVTLTSDEVAALQGILDDFTSKGIMPSSNGKFQMLSAGAQAAVRGVLNPAIWAQQEIGARNATLGATWEGSTLRAQTNWLRDYVGTSAHTAANKDGNLTERINWSHEQISRLDRELDDLEKGVAMAGALKTTYVERGRRGSIDISVASFGGQVGYSVGAGIRISKAVQFQVGASAARDMDDYLVRAGVNIQF